MNFSTVLTLLKRDQQCVAFERPTKNMFYFGWKKCSWVIVVSTMIELFTAVFFFFLQRVKVANQKKINHGFYVWNKNKHSSKELFSVFSAIADNYKVLNKCTITFLQITFTMQILRQINTSYLTDSYIIFTLKMESVSKNTIFGLKMMVKSGLEKIILKFHHGFQRYLLTCQANSANLGRVFCTGQQQL